MGGAFGCLGWAPSVFWAATLTEYLAAIAGYNRRMGGDKEDEGKGPSDDELAALVAKYG